jgi:hypothetical protein
VYIGEIVNVGNSYFVYVPSVPVKQKVYNMSSIQAMNIIDKYDSRIVEVVLIPKQDELDEQPEYTAHIINPIINNNEENSK